MPGVLVADAAFDDQEPAGEPASRVGRPRDPRVDDAIHRATLALLVEVGYQATTIQAIARRAGVSAPSIYRRWSSKAELIEDAVFPSGMLAPTSLTGDVIGDLRSYCQIILEHLSEPAVRTAIPGLLTEYQTDPRLWQRAVERSVVPMREAFAAFLEQSGRKAVGTPDGLFDVLLGALFTRALNVGAEDAADFAHQVSLVVTAAMVPVAGAGDRRRR